MVLQEFRRQTTGEYFYGLGMTTPEGAERVGEPLCRVWKSPSTQATYDWSARPAP